MPTSVLLAVLAAASLLALAPAMVRRYDATERLVAERATSTARVLSRRRRRRTVPGRFPVNSPRLRLLVAMRSLAVPVVNDDGSFADDPAGTGSGSVDSGSAGSGADGSRSAGSGGVGSGGAGSGAGGSESAGSTGSGSARRIRTGGDGRSSGGRSGSRSIDVRSAETVGAGRKVGRRGRPARATLPAGIGRPRPGRRRPATAVHRRRRVFLVLVLLNVVELVGVGLVGPGFWVGFAGTATLLLAYLVHLRRRAVVAARHRRSAARQAAWIAAQQAAIRREHERRAVERREAARRAAAEREAARRQASEYTQRYARRDVQPEGPRELATGTESGGAPPPRRAVLRGRAYEHRAGRS